VASNSVLEKCIQTPIGDSRRTRPGQVGGWAFRKAAMQSENQHQQANDNYKTDEKNDTCSAGEKLQH